jgi:hypothetical protein
LPSEELVWKNLLHEYQLQVQAGECEGIVLNCNMCHVLSISHKKAASLQAARVTENRMLNGHNVHKMLLCILALQIQLQSLANLAHKDFSMLR